MNETNVYRLIIKGEVEAFYDEKGSVAYIGDGLDSKNVADILQEFDGKVVKLTIEVKRESKCV